jgi:hypothetical protein
MHDDQILFAWIRHYALVIGALVIFGLVGGLLYTLAAPRRAEAWSIVIETGARIPPLQLGPVSEAIFRSAAVYRPVMSDLGITGSPSRFLSEDVELLPIPETNTLIVVGRASELSRAEALSAAMARSLVNAFTVRGGFTGFEVFDRPQPAPVRSGISTSTALVFAGTIGFWIGLAVAGIHYRWRRPVLTKERAEWILRPDRVLILQAHRPAVLGAVRHPRVSDLEGARELIHGLAKEREDAIPVLMAPGLDGGGERTWRRAWRRIALGDGSHESTDGAPGEAGAMLLCDPSTTERQLTAAALLARPGTNGANAWLGLLWVD